MPEYLAPGVYIEEIARGPTPIEGVSTSTAAFLGETERGPVMPQLVTSYNEYSRLYGGPFSPGQYMPHALSSFFENGGRRCYVCRVPSRTAVAGAVAFPFAAITARGPGTWSKRLFIKIDESRTKRDKPGNSLRIQLAYWSADTFLVVAAGGKVIDPFEPGSTIKPRPDMVEVFDEIDFLNPASPDHYSKRITGSSALIDVAAPDKPFFDSDPVDLKTSAFSGGEDGDVITVADFDNDDEDDISKWQGLRALQLDQYRDVSLVYAPYRSGDTGQTIAKKIISHCENERFRFAVIDCLPGKGNPGDNALDPRTSLTDTKYAAMYYPWITIAEPGTGGKVSIPPGGSVLGIYARTDNDRGVFKAPANEIVRGALSLEYNIDNASQEVLNPRSVNVIRQFPGRGIRIWGARTLSSQSEWKYVSVRRLFIFLEASIFEGTQWVVFEPNDERLWARVKDTVRLFLRSQFRLGALMGATEAEAFHIVCDRTTMTQDDILNGRLICQVGIAPVRPAEFVCFRIFQSTAEAQS
jgi:phage tail sheath protein FI